MLALNAFMCWAMAFTILRPLAILLFLTFDNCTNLVVCRCGWVGREACLLATQLGCQACGRIAWPACCNSWHLWHDIGATVDLELNCLFTSHIWWSRAWWLDGQPNNIGATILWWSRAWTKRDTAMLHSRRENTKTQSQNAAFYFKRRNEQTQSQTQLLNTAGKLWETHGFRTSKRKNTNTANTTSKHKANTSANHKANSKQTHKHKHRNTETQSKHKHNKHNHTKHKHKSQQTRAQQPLRYIYIKCK